MLLSRAWAKDDAPVPSDAEIRGWVQALMDFGRDDPVFPGCRIAGSASEEAATQYIVAQLESFGLPKVWREPVPITGWEPQQWSLTVLSAAGSAQVPSCPVFYTPFTPSTGVTGQLVDVGEGGQGDFAKCDVRGKIVLANQNAGVFSYDSWQQAALEVYDPKGLIRRGMQHPNAGPGDLKSLHEAAKRGAVAFIGIVVNNSEEHRCFPNASALADPAAGRLGPIPGAYVNSSAGEELRQFARDGAEVTWTATGSTPHANSWNVIAELPGLSGERVQLNSHTDGGAVENASGVAAVLALAKHYSMLPLSSRPRTFQVVLTGGHFSNFVGETAFLRRHRQDALVRQVRLNVTVEHIGRQYDAAGGEMVASGGIWAPSVFVSDRRLLLPASEAVHAAGLSPSFIMPPEAGRRAGGGAFWAWDANEPSIWCTSPAEYLGSTADTMDRYSEPQMRRVLDAFTDVIDRLNGSNVAPVASNQIVATKQDAPVKVALTAADPNGDPVTYSVVSGPVHGKLSGHAPVLTYTPAGGYVGRDSFAFQANDGKLDSNVATVSLGVVGTTTETFPSAGRAIHVERFDLADTSARHPAIMLIHTVYGVEDKNWVETAVRCAVGLAGHGYVVFFPHYFEGTGIKTATGRDMVKLYAAWMATLADAITYASGAPDVDPERIGLAGHSSGAALSLSIASQDARVKAVAEYGGYVPARFAESMKRMPPTLILHGMTDTAVSVNEALKLEHLLQEAKVPHAMKIYPGEEHRFRGPAEHDSIQRMIRFFDDHLRPEEAKPMGDVSRPSPGR